jgi:hypothetical protein
MKHALPAVETFSCPECGEESFRYASLCHACGRSFTDSDKVHNSTRGQGNNHGAPRQWEPLIGAVLLILVLAFALFTWASSTIQGNAYHDGLAAEGRHDWDAAVAYFTQAGDHPGAQAHLGSATRTRDERDRFYTDGTGAIARKEWNEALTALSKVREIEPGFRDSDALYLQAEQGVERKAAAGIIYLVTDGPQPGLYYLDSTGTPVHLPGSDEHSVVRAVSSAGDTISLKGALIYDRPEEGGRTVALAWPGEPAADGVITTIPIRARILDPEGMGIFSRDGIWWFAPPDESASPGSEILYFRSFQTDRVFCPTTCGNTIPLHEGSTRVAALDPSTSRILLATTSGDSGSPNFHTSLYLAGPWGNNPLLLHEPAGDVDGATFSTDGRWLLYLTEQNNEPTSRRLWVLRVPDSDGIGAYGRPRQIGFLQFLGDTSAVLTGRFLHSHDGQTPLVITRRTGFGKRLSVFSLADSDSTNLDGFGWPSGALRQIASQIDLVEPDSTYGYEASAFAHKGLALAQHWQQGLRSQISLYSYEADRTLRYTFPFPLTGSRPAEIYFSPLDDYLAVVLSGRPGAGGDSVQNIYVTKVNRDQAPGSPQLLASTPLPQGPYHPTFALPRSGTHIVYINDAQALRAARYSGEKDTLLAEHAAAVWDLKAEPDTTRRP